MKLVCVSDSHGMESRLSMPEGDVLIHAGDATSRGTLEEVIAFNKWLGTLPYEHKIFVPGNHDFLFEKNESLARALLTNATVLIDQSIQIGPLKLYGSPWQPWFYNWAFNLPRGEIIAKKWAQIPTGLDVLITHGPPHTILDATKEDFKELHVGCEELLKRVREVKPRYHVFGHIHEGYGQLTSGETTFINASVCTRGYKPINPVITVEV